MSRFPFLIRAAARHIAVAAVTSGVLLFGASPAWAQVPGVDFYLGAGIGTGDVTIVSPGGAVDQFKENHTAFKVFGGLRAASVLGVELDYLNFGKTSGALGSDPDVTGKLTGGAAFGLFYIPLPLPVLDIYAKAGLARLNKKISDFTLGDFSTKGTDFGYGAGVQFKLGSFAIRGEYETFNTDGKDPTLLTLGFSKSFL